MFTNQILYFLLNEEYISFLHTFLEEAKECLNEINNILKEIENSRGEWGEYVHKNINSLIEEAYNLLNESDDLDLESYAKLEEKILQEIEEDLSEDEEEFYNEDFELNEEDYESFEYDNVMFEYDCNFDEFCLNYTIFPSF